MDKTDCGFFRDESFRLLNIKELAKVGENILELRSIISQSEATYEHLSKSWDFESMKNSLSYDMEVEQVYIVGDFGGAIRSEIIDAGEEAIRITEPPVIAPMPTSVDISVLHLSGFPEFSGELTLCRELEARAGESLFVEPTLFGINSVHISVNGTEVAVRMFPPYRVDISPYLKEGKNTLELTLVNNLRNLR